MADRVAERLALQQAVEALPGTDFAALLHDVAAALPVAVSVEAVTIRLREAETERLHLLAAAGMPSRDVRRLSLERLTIPQARTLLAVGAEHSLARAVGLVWLHGRWLADEGDPLGLLLVGSRTRRRPDDDDLAQIAATAERVAERLTRVERSPAALRAASLSLVRRLVLETTPSLNGRLAELRPREQTILELYADGLSASEIAELLVISPHTVRTHVKLAFKRLDIHSREEAIEIVRRDQLLTLL
ncbi:MAG: response regulator transcription factor [Gaiellaceae bacterium]